MIEYSYKGHKELYLKEFHIEIPKPNESEDKKIQFDLTFFSDEMTKSISDKG